MTWTNRQAAINPRKPTRIQIPAYTDMWMKGARYGELIRTYQHKSTPQTIAVVKLDATGKTIKVFYDDCTVVD